RAPRQDGGQLERRVTPRTGRRRQRLQTLGQLIRRRGVGGMQRQQNERQVAEGLVQGAIRRHFLVDGDGPGGVASLGLEGRRLQLRKRGVTVAATGESLQCCRRAGVGGSNQLERRLVLPRPLGMLILGVALPLEEGRHPQHDQGGQAERIAAVLAPELCEVLAPQLLVDFADDVAHVIALRKKSALPYRDDSAIANYSGQRDSSSSHGRRRESGCARAISRDADSREFMAPTRRTMCESGSAREYAPVRQPTPTMC